MTKTQQPPATKQPGRYKGPAVAMAALLAVLTVAGLYIAFSGGIDQVVDQTTLPTPTTVPTTPTEPTQPATFEELAGEWRATPLILSDAVLQEIDEQCLRQLEFLAPTMTGVTRVVADARGEGKVHLIYAREDRHHAWCEAIVTAEGHIEAAVYSHTMPPEPIPAVEATELEYWGGANSPGSALPEDRWNSVLGEAGTGIHQVIAEVEGLPPIVASLGDGWFSFWYPIDTDETLADDQWRSVVIGVDADGNEVTRVLMG